MAAMENYEDDDLALPLPEDRPSPPPAQRKLRRLKRASSPPADPIAVDPPQARETPDPDGSTIAATMEPEQEKFDEETASDDGLDPLFSAPVQCDGWGDQHMDRGGEEEEEGRTGPDESGESGRGGKKSAKKRLNLGDGEEAASNNKRSRSRKSLGDDGKHKESAREKKKLEKERKAHLDLLHAETQRLLRETGNASFRPVPLVQKSISSVLGKIRQRKLEVSKGLGHSSQSLSSTDADCEMCEVAQNSKLPESQNDGEEDNETIRLESDVHLADVGGNASPTDLSGSDCCDEASDGEDVKNSFQSSVNDTQKLKSGDTNKNDEDTFKDSLVSSLPTTSSKHDLADNSSPEEESDKENVDPHPYKVVNMNSYAEGSLVKDFLDDEAEEEDDSDHDLMRFEENEEDDESDENELLKDLIATGYKEAPKDQEKRNQLHQKWLEQQDTAATENVLQRLQCGLLQDGDDEEEACEDSDDVTLYDQVPSKMVQKSSRKAKQMIAQMFTDGNDAYIPSDDEETEHALVRQRILRQNEEEPSFISPIEDENSREVFGLIKKLNIAPDTKKKGKLSTSTFDTVLTGGNSNSSSKSSFLGRAMNNSLPSSHKQGSTTIRTFIFGRDDSNSRSGISMSENLSDMDQKENQCKRTASVKVSSSQFKASVSKTKVEGTSSGSLFDILRQSSMHFDKQLENRSQGGSSVISETQAAFQFSAFKLGKRVSRLEARH